MEVTAYTGTYADLLPHILALYVRPGAVVADVTFGKGVFWQRVDTAGYDFRASDILTGTDLRHLPYEDESVDVLVLDPPYMHGGKGVKDSINRCYRNENSGHGSIVRLYGAGILEAARVLKRRGVIIVKCQDEIESGKQRWSHMELCQLLTLFGYEVVDLFILVQAGQPAMRENYQKSARRNHSYALVGRLRWSTRTQTWNLLRTDSAGWE